MADTQKQETKQWANEEERWQAAIDLIQSWRDAEGEDAQEQHDTYEYLVKALNANLELGQRRRI